MQPPDDLRNAFTLRNDPVNHLFFKLRTRTRVIFQELSVIDDPIERIIDLMGHARGKLADRSQL